MKITSNTNHFPKPDTTAKAPTDKGNTGQAEKAAKTQVDAYIPSKPSTDINYKKPDNTSLIEKLKAESEQAHEQLRNLVRQLLERQGMRFQDVISGEKELVVDEEARLQAQAAIGEGGPSSPENVSDRIVEFAKAISGGDKSKFELLKGAIQDGFEAARQALGGTLPDISNKTYDLVMEKLDRWMEEE